MLNKLKIFSLILITQTSMVALADDNISLHVECYPVTSDCVEMEYYRPSEEKMFVMRNAEMVITEKDVTSAIEGNGQYAGQNELAIRLTDGASEKFRQLTETHKRKALAIVTKGKIVMAPRINDTISGGSIVISNGFDKNSNPLENIPWLKKMADDEKSLKEKVDTTSIVTYILLAILLIGGAIYFAFFRHKIKPTKYE